MSKYLLNKFIPHPDVSWLDDAPKKCWYGYYEASPNGNITDIREREVNCGEYVELLRLFKSKSDAVFEVSTVTLQDFIKLKNIRIGETVECLINKDKTITTIFYTGPFGDFEAFSAQY